jgi:hypothetical protein
MGEARPKTTVCSRKVRKLEGCVCLGCGQQIRSARRRRESGNRGAARMRDEEDLSALQGFPEGGATIIASCRCIVSMRREGDRPNYLFMDETETFLAASCFHVNKRVPRRGRAAQMLGAREDEDAAHQTSSIHPLTGANKLYILHTVQSEPGSSLPAHRGA